MGCTKKLSDPFSRGCGKGAGPDLIVDGGIRRGTHVIKAIAAGATACSFGRPYLYGLAAAGETSVDRGMELMRAELERDMTMLGVNQATNLCGRHVTRLPGVPGG
ncbi:MAG: alpha-hydroxy-acid oxidizing protein [Pseudomonadota bacterium]